MAKCTLILYMILVSLYASNAYKILLVSSLPGKSIGILSEGMIQHLSEAGHEITYLSGFPPDKAIPNINIIKVEHGDYINKKKEEMLNLKDNITKKTDMIELFKRLTMISNMTLSVLKADNVQNLMKDKNQNFDVAIVFWSYNDIYAGLAEVFNCPLVWVSSVSPHWKLLQLVDEVPSAAYTTDLMSANAPPLTFTQRVTELGYQVAGYLLDKSLLANEVETYDNYIAPIIRSRGREPASLPVIKYNASLVLGNSHISMGSPVRLPDCYKHIGGYHIQKNVRPLSENLKKIFDDAKHGVIYFSMGSNLKSKTLPDAIKRSLLAMFGKLKQIVLWKFEEDLPDRPKNVHIIQWAPQLSILAHEKCLLFITHGGLLSTTEAIHFGVPTIGIPVFADQFTNVARAVNRGFARKVDLSFDMADRLYTEINEVLSNPSYKQKVRELSLIYHDRPASPGAELVHWVEHVVRTRGAPHLRSPALHLPWYQKLFLDLVAVLAVVGLVLVYAIKSLICFVKSKICSQKKVKKH